MRQAEELYRESKLTEAISSLQALLREHPSEKKARNFLFELLCFAGEFERARKQLSILAEDSNESRMGMAFYFAALAAEMERQTYYGDRASPQTEDTSGAPSGASEGLSGSFNGKPFSSIRDLDARLGPALEFLAAGRYHRIALRNLSRLEIAEPKRLRDLYWLPANAQTAESLGAEELDSILIPVLYPHTYLFDDDQTRLGRTTDWALADDGAEIPCGQRILLIDGVEVPLLQVRSLEFGPPGEGDRTGHV
jgi:type VI secretion system protein ImpE